VQIGRGVKKNDQQVMKTNFFTAAKKTWDRYFVFVARSGLDLGFWRQLK
jgi:hypothetical protein